MSVVVIERRLVEDVASTWPCFGMAEDIMRDAVDSGDVFADTFALWIFAARFDPLFFNRWQIGRPSEDA